MDTSLNFLEIELVEASPADASQLASELREYLLDEEPDLDVEQARSDPASQDLGATLILLLAAPSITAVARGLARWVERRGQNCIEFSKGKTSLRMTNLSDKTAAQLGQELVSFLKDEKVKE
jgi:hypothetical protein